MNSLHSATKIKKHFPNKNGRIHRFRYKKRPHFMAIWGDCALWELGNWIISGHFYESAVGRTFIFYFGGKLRTLHLAILRNNDQRIFKFRNKSTVLPKTSPCHQTPVPSPLKSTPNMCNDKKTYNMECILAFFRMRHPLMGYAICVSWINDAC